MKNATKGALFSGLVFPGLGQIVLKRKMRGWMIVLIVVTSLYFLVTKIVETALAIVDDVQSQGGIIDVSELAATATQLTSNSTELTLNFLFLLIIFCWIASSIDAYRIGKQMDHKKAT